MEVEIGSGNVFADLGFRHAEKHKTKSGLASEIKVVRDLRCLRRFLVAHS